MARQTFEQWAEQMRFPTQEQQELARDIVRGCREAVAGMSAEIAAKIRALTERVSDMDDGRQVREQCAAMLQALSWNVLMHCRLENMPEAEDALYDAADLASGILPDDEDADDEGGSALRPEADWMIEAMHRAAREGPHLN